MSLLGEYVIPRKILPACSVIAWNCWRKVQSLPENQLELSEPHFEYYSCAAPEVSPIQSRQVACASYSGSHGV